MTVQPVNIAIQESLANDAQALALEVNVSRDELIALALKDYMRRYRQRKKLVNDINAAYADEPDESDQKYRQQALASHRRLVEGEW